MANEELKRTGFHDVHESLGAKMVPFAGFRMPVMYDSITAEHRSVRERVGVFDVSHMGEVVFEGPDASVAVQRVTVNDVTALTVDQAQYSAIVAEDGGIVDDCLVYRTAEDAYMMVVNASNREKDLAHIEAHRPGGEYEVRDVSDETSLLTVQGPRAEEVLAAIVDVPLGEIGFYRMAQARVAGVRAIVSRTGYTGEDGFELYFDRAESETTWKAVSTAGAGAGIKPCGLGARDTLRLEMGYALYGNDIDETTNPYEARLGWIVKLEKGDFVGRDALVRVLEAGPARKLVGFRLKERGIPRPGYDVILDGERVSRVRSGTMSPSLGYGIGTCYLPADRAGSGAPIGIEVRGDTLEAEVVQMPFYQRGSLKR